MSGYNTVVGEFKGHKTITINGSDGKRVITIGVNKAKAILATIEDIKKFIEKNDNTVTVSVDDQVLEETNLVQSLVQE